jgi:hypothetical protein
MTATTITDVVEVNDPNKEVVIITATDLNTFVSRKFAVITGVQATIMEDAGALSLPISCDVSGGTVEINCTGLSALKTCLTIYGRK